MAIDEPASFFVDGWKYKLREHNKKARKNVKIRREIKEASDCYSKTDF